MKITRKQRHKIIKEEILREAAMVGIEYLAVGREPKEVETTQNS